MSISQWSTTPANNATGVTGVNWAEGQAPSTVNDSARGLMSDVAAWVGQASGSIPEYLSGVAGTNTVTATGPAQMAAYVAGQRFHFIPAVTNTGATTLNITPSGGAALGAKNVFFRGVAVTGGELVANVPTIVVYDGTQFNILWAVKTGSTAILTLDQASGSAGGGTTATTWTKYPLNTEVIDADNITALASSAFDLAAGTYEVTAFAYFYSSDATANHGKLRLRNTTDSTTTIVGGNHNTPALSGSNVPNICWLDGRFVLSGTKTFELQYYVSTAKATSGLGVALTSGEVERYGSIKIRKLLSE